MPLETTHDLGQRNLEVTRLLYRHDPVFEETSMTWDTTTFGSATWK